MKEIVSVDWMLANKPTSHPHSQLQKVAVVTNKLPQQISAVLHQYSITNYIYTYIVPPYLAPMNVCEQQFPIIHNATVHRRIWPCPCLEGIWWGGSGGVEV